jgi:hypothetical protein
MARYIPFQLLNQKEVFLKYACILFINLFGTKAFYQNLSLLLEGRCFSFHGALPRLPPDMLRPEGNLGKNGRFAKIS